MGRLGLLAATAACTLFLQDPASAIVKKKFRKPVVADLSKTTVNVDAERIEVDSNTHLVTATGRVVLKNGPYTLIATKVVYNQRTKVLTANGSVMLTEPNGNKAYATTMSVDTAFRDGFARHVKALLNNDVAIAADYAKRSDGRITVFTNSHYTACGRCETKDGTPVWELVATQTTHDQKEHTLAHINPRLKIGGVTVGALPYAKLPDPSVKRKTGFLFPDYTYTDTAGFGVVLPFFWALAPNYDLTFRPDFTLKQGPVADVEWRHRLSKGSYNIRAYGVRQLNPVEPYDGERWRGAFETQGRFWVNRDWKWGWDGIQASDKNFLRRYGYNSTIIGTNDLIATGLWDQTYIDARLLSFEALTNNVDQDQLPLAVPYFSAEQTLRGPVLGGDVSWNVNAYSLMRNQEGSPFETVNHGTEQSRMEAQLGWQKETVSGLGTVLTTSAKLRSDLYVTKDLPDPLSPGVETGTKTSLRVLPSAGVDLRWPFIGSSSWGQSIFTPVMQVFAATNETDTSDIGNEDAITLNFDHTNLFLEDRFTGLDRYEGGVRANAGLTYNFMADNGAFVRASAGESFHLAGKNSFGGSGGLEGTRSDLVGAVAVSPWNGISMSYEARAAEDLSAIHRQEALLGLSFDRFTSNFGYLYINQEPEYGRKKSEEFVTANARVRLSPGWYALANANYDLQKDFFRQIGLGVEFDCDCMNAKLMYTRTKSSIAGEFDNRVMLSLDLATLFATSATGRF